MVYFFIIFLAGRTQNETAVCSISVKPHKVINFEYEILQIISGQKIAMQMCLWFSNYC